MPQPVLVSDVAVEISFGADPQSEGGAGSIPSAPSANFECQAKTLSVTIEARTIDLTTLCSTTEQTFTTGLTGTLDIELFVDEATGPIFAYKSGYLCKVTVNPGGAGSTLTYQGLVTTNTQTYENNNVEMESASIKLGAFGFNSVY
jgi:nucleoside phosphorylase